jgi:hypothetical protein
MRIILAFFVHVILSISAFNSANVKRPTRTVKRVVVKDFNVFESFFGQFLKKDPAIAKRSLLAAIVIAKQDGTEATEEAVRAAFKEVEAVAPTPPDLLDDSSALLLDGPWVLQYTIAAFGRLEGGTQRGIQGAVNATGIAVDTSGVGVRTTQTFDIMNGRVSNDISKTLFDSLEARLQVSGPFKRSLSSGRRADVKFDTLKLGLGGVEVTIDWIFDLVYRLRKDESESWLETTHLSKDMRLGRGNKGSLFVLTRA